MAQEILVERRNWMACWKALEDRFERPVPAEFRSGEIDLEALLRHLTPAENDFTWRGRIMIGLELRAALQTLLECDSADLQQAAKLSELFPQSTRKARWRALQDMLEWKLPRIGLPVWAQYVWGAGLMAGFVMMFVWPLWGLLLFFGGIVLSFQAEKAASAFQYATLDETIAAMVRLNWPALEMGAADDAHMRLAFAEVLDSHFVPDVNPESAFPLIVVDDPFVQPHPQWHVLSGDSLRETYDDAAIPGERVVMRECFVVGPLPAVDRSWKVRAEFIRLEYDTSVDKYAEWVVKQLDRLVDVPSDAEINLWFEDDLFCQVNLWFTVALLLNGDQPRRIFRVFPPMRDGEDRWDGFGGMDEPGMRAAMAGRVAFGVADLELAKALWLAFKGRDWPRMEALAKTESPCFRDLEAVVAAQIARFPADGSLGRPHRVLSAILAEGKVAFEDIFKEFSRRAGIYGFGDLQVKSLLRELDAAQAMGGPDA